MSKAKEARQRAYGKLLDAKALADRNGGDILAEDQEQFEQIMAEFADLDKAAEEAEKAEGLEGRLKDRLSWYNESATGKPMHFEEFKPDPKSARTPGEQFVQSEAFQQLLTSGALDSDKSGFRTNRVIVGNPRGRQMIGAAATDLIHTATGGPAEELVQPYRPGVMLPLPQMPTVVRDLFPNENMPSGNTIEYAAQVGFDNAAAAVAQATTTSNGAKPQSSIAWEERTSTATWIATWMAATRQSLSDVNQLRSMIDNQGRLMIRLEEDDQLLNGDGVAPNLTGILDDGNVGLQTLDLTGVDNLDGLRTARRMVKTGLSRLDADFVVLNPIDSEEFDLLKDGNGQYRGGNPIGNFTFDQPIWRLRRVESEAMTAGTGLVGSGVGATVYERQPLSVLVADQHSDFFIRNLVVILFEERLAFPIYFPTAFVEVTFSEWVA